MANLITNPGFETNTTSWDTSSSAFTNAGATLTRITTDFYTGSACGRVVYTNALNQMGINFRSMTLAASTAYLFSAYIKVVSGQPVRVRVRDWNNGTAIFAATDFTSATDWTYVQAYITTGASAGASANNVLSVVTDTTAAAGEFLVDEVRWDTYTPINSGGILTSN